MFSLSLKHALHGLAIISVLTLTACKNGGELTLESGARRVISQGSPYVQVNQGGQAMIVEQGQTPTTGVHGWVTIQAIKSDQLGSGVGQPVMTLNRKTH